MYTVLLIVTSPETDFIGRSWKEVKISFFPLHSYLYLNLLISLDELVSCSLAIQEMRETEKERDRILSSNICASLFIISSIFNLEYLLYEKIEKRRKKSVHTACRKLIYLSMFFNLSFWYPYGKSNSSWDPNRNFRFKGRLSWTQAVVPWYSPCAPPVPSSSTSEDRSLLREKCADKKKMCTFFS